MTPQTRALIEAAEYLLKMVSCHCDNEEECPHANLRAAISSAKAAEEGVETETMYRVDMTDKVGWVMELCDRHHETEDAANARADLALTYSEAVSVRIVLVEVRETVILVREKEGL